MYDYMVVSPDFEYAIIWGNKTNCLIYNLTSMGYLYAYQPPNDPNFLVTQTITFSKNSTLVLIETDRLNPIIILNILPFQIVNQI